MMLMSRPCMALIHVPGPPIPTDLWYISLSLWHHWCAWPEDPNGDWM